MLVGIRCSFLSTLVHDGLLLFGQPVLHPFGRVLKGGQYPQLFTRLGSDGRGQYGQSLAVFSFKNKNICRATRDAVIAKRRHPALVDYGWNAFPCRKVRVFIADMPHLIRGQHNFRPIRLRFLPSCRAQPKV